MIFKRVVFIFCSVPATDYVESLRDTINAFYQNPSNKFSVKKAKETKEAKNVEIAKAKMLKLIQSMWYDTKNGYKILYYIDQQFILNVNALAKTQIRILIEFYETLKKDNCIFLNYSALISKWLDCEGHGPLHINFKNVATLEDYIQEYLDKEIQSFDELENFYISFMELYTKKCSEKFKYDTQELERVLKFHKEKARRKATINRALKNLEMPYEMIKKNNKWILIRK